MKRSLSLLSLFFMITVANANEKLIFAIDLIRHGDRAPMHDLPKDPHYWKEGLAELTPEGMLQEFKLGESKRKIYIEHYHLLPNHYQDDTLYVRSTDTNRTLMSAEAFLLGLYPLGTGSMTLPHQFQPIPIHSVPKKHDNLLAAYDQPHQLKPLLEKYVYETPEWKAKTASVSAKFKKWSEASGLTIAKLTDLIHLGDDLFIRQLHHITIPKGLSEQDTKEIIATAGWAIAYREKHKEVGAPLAHEFLSTVIDYLNDASKKQSALKYILYVAHDTTILSVMSGMQTPLDTPPPFASDLNFSLYENGQKQYIKVSFNGKVLKIPGCQGDSCTLAEFSKLAGDLDS